MAGKGQPDNNNADGMTACGHADDQLEWEHNGNKSNSCSTTTTMRLVLDQRPWPWKANNNCDGDDDNDGNFVLSRVEKQGQHL